MKKLLAMSAMLLFVSTSFADNPKPRGPSRSDRPNIRAVKPTTRRGFHTTDRRRRLSQSRVYPAQHVQVIIIVQKDKKEKRKISSVKPSAHQTIFIAGSKKIIPRARTRQEILRKLRTKVGR